MGLIRISRTLTLKTVTTDSSLTVEPFSLYSISVHVNREAERLFGIATVSSVFFLHGFLLCAVLTCCSKLSA